MHAIFTKTMAAVLFVHATFGCCWHHAHACESWTRGEAPAKCCASHGDGERRESQRPCDEDDTCEGSCTYLAPGKVQVDDLQAVAALDLAAIGPNFADEESRSATQRELIFFCGVLEPPLRLHLLNQILLV